MDCTTDDVWWAWLEQWMEVPEYKESLVASSFGTWEDETFSNFACLANLNIVFVNNVYVLSFLVTRP